MNRRDLLLNEMNITQWVLTKPQVLKGDAQIHLSPQIKLVVVCEEDHQQSARFHDILRSLNFAPQEYQWLNLEQSLRLTFQHEPLFWLIQPAQQAGQFRQKFANQTAYCQLEQWQDLDHSAQKRQFWQQIQPFSQHIESSQ